VGDGSRAAPRSGEALEGEGRGASAAIGRHGMDDSGPTAALTGDARASGAQPAAKQGRVGLTGGPPLQSRAAAV
jgi:hypothetical protein